ncbi:Retrovirus-related Pol polyprotein from transposon TNT 1-94 [Gossypium australe]|uniref:Retrovirus-related Pol polyprotein from transposon TNT 1-94 n=1 Tax=Gossypium australe TaxID=47621 RepID=A0A5B6UUK2_9ROSI|nr:Retrovirus-related Pol polyprotein from transposon TNT 1-94 [Gossypium australe]
MKVEMNSMQSNSVWELVDLPKWIKPIERKWIYKKKKKCEWKSGNLQSQTCSKRNLFSSCHSQVNLHIVIHCDGSRLYGLKNGCQDNVLEWLS